ncbi:hypothetical protein [Acidicapsa acidisoli]|uniref:hypothetical protein n=1 Tax=Acidicapsa acidisoli TaxID=1615681 RepID=UPI0021E01008|nr:hypothetical protein [Acidicapsa acidisoli]
MSDTASRNPTAAAQMLTDALLRTVAGTTATLQVAGANPDTDQSEIGLVATNFAEVVVSPVVMRKIRPTWKEGGESKWELLLSATGVQQSANTLNLASVESLFAMTLGVTVAGQNYLIESIGASEALGQVYLYRLLLREAGVEAV